MITDDREGHQRLVTMAESRRSSNIRALQPVGEDLSAEVPQLLRALSFKPIGAGTKRTRPGFWAAEVLMFCLRRCSGAWVASVADELGRMERGGDALARRWAAYALTREAYRKGDWAGIDARCADPSVDVRRGTQEALGVEISYANFHRDRDLKAIENAVDGLRASGRTSGDATPFHHPTRATAPLVFDAAPILAPLRAGLRDSQVDVRKAAAAAVRDLAFWLKVDPTPFAPELETLLRDKDSEILMDMAEVYGRLPPGVANADHLTDLVVELIGHPNGKVRQKALLALTQAGNGPHVGRYLGLLPRWLASDDRVTRPEVGFLVRRLAQDGVDIGASVPLIAGALGRYSTVVDRVYSQALVAFGGGDAVRRDLVLDAVRSAAPQKAARSIAKELGAKR